jgi:hypothetical protein
MFSGCSGLAIRSMCNLPIEPEPWRYPSRHGLRRVLLVPGGTAKDDVMTVYRETHRACPTALAPCLRWHSP